MIDSGDTAWVLACTALVLFMTPGLAFFYAGMVRVRNVLSMMMVNFVPLGVVTVLWLLLGTASRSATTPAAGSSVTSASSACRTWTARPRRPCT